MDLNERIRGLLFDKDGTLFDFNATWGSWAQHFFRTIAEDDENATILGHALGFDLASGAFESDSLIIAGTPNEVATKINRVKPELPVEHILNVANQTAAEAPQAEITPLRPFLERLRTASLKLGVSTNDAEAPARAHLASADVDDLFDFIAGYDSGFGAKPEPGMQLAFCHRLGLNPSDVAMVGDSLHDLRAGKAAGMITIGVLTGHANRSVLAPAADLVLDSIKELPQWLGIP